MWEFNIIYFVFVILVLKQSVITLSNIPTIYIYIYHSNNTKMYVIINNTCVQFYFCIIRSMHIRGGVKLCDQPCIQCVG